MRKKIPTLGAVAAAEAENEKKTKVRGLLTSLAALLGADDTGTPGAKMSKRTETTKHVIMEESDDDAEEERYEEEEEGEAEGEEEADSETDSTTDDSETPAAEEEEEEKAIAKAYAAADKAFAKAVDNDPALLLRAPSRLAREAAKATGQKNLSATMGALSGFREVLRKQEKTAARVDQIEEEQRETKVNARLSTALKEGRITRAEVASLKEQGMKDPRWLRGHLAILPKRVRTRDDGPIQPREGTDGTTALGALTPEQEKILATVTADMKPEAAAKARADFTSRLATQNTTSAGRVRPRS